MATTNNMQARERMKQIAAFILESDLARDHLAEWDRESLTNRAKGDGGSTNDLDVSFRGVGRAGLRINCDYDYSDSVDPETGNSMREYRFISTLNCGGITDAPVKGVQILDFQRSVAGLGLILQSQGLLDPITVHTATKEEREAREREEAAKKLADQNRRKAINAGMPFTTGLRVGVKNKPIPAVMLTDIPDGSYEFTNDHKPPKKYRITVRAGGGNIRRTE